MAASVVKFPACFLIAAETVRLDGGIASKLARPSVAKGGAAIGTALIVPGDEALVERIRDVAGAFAGEVGISATNRNFKGRMGSRDAQCYLASPEVVLR